MNNEVIQQVNTEAKNQETPTNEGQSAGNQDQRLDELDLRMNRMTTSLETLIGIIKATDPTPQPVRQQLNFEPVSTVALASNPNRSQFAFVGPTAPPQNPQPQTAENRPNNPPFQPTNPAIPQPFPS
ncbi:hypothetical protein PGT21_027977 [Puccinia graminis f. sp. tritici]|uniref:Uncharacterized protein n=1 Tax=Puccinia graminis f. sp. tritici TaxID=56615 RepID=A0A5B0N8L2_PUCGR|nr:hypothetical protein PGT21_027977 [Puccinia graminis f. sp. tritici]